MVRRLPVGGGPAGEEGGGGEATNVNSKAVTPAVLKAKIKIKTTITPRIRPTTPASEGKRQSGTSLGTPRGRGDKKKIKSGRPETETGMHTWTPDADVPGSRVTPTSY